MLTAPLKALTCTLPWPGLDADRGGRAGESHAETDKEDRNRAVEETLKGEEVRERHDKVSFFALASGGAEAFGSVRPGPGGAGLIPIWTVLR